MPGLLALIDERLPSGRYRADEPCPRDGHELSAPRRSRCRRARGARAARRRAGCAATRCACWWSAAATASVIHTRFDELPRSCSSRRPARGQHLGHGARPALPRAGADGSELELRLSTRAPHATTRAGGSSSCAAGGRRPSAAAARRRARSTLPGGGGADARWRPTPAARACGSPASSCAEPRAWPTSRRHGHPIRYRYVPARVAARRPTRPSSRASPGSAEMPSAGRPFTPELVTELVARGVASWRRSRCTPASPRSSAASRPYPERYRVPARDRRLVNADARLGRPRDRRRAPPSSARWRPSPTPDGGVARGRGLDRRWWSPPSAACRVGRRAASPAGTSPRPRTSRCSRRSPATTLLDRSLPRPRSTRGYLWHEFGDSHLILP